jgi:hypothetical protein
VHMLAVHILAAHIEPALAPRPKTQIEQSIEAAFLTRVTMACEDHVARLEPMSFEDLEKEPIDAYAQAVLILFGKLGDILDANKRFPPERTRCGWCVRAAGGDQAAWDAAPWLQYPDEVVAHALICEHNPPVRKLYAAWAKTEEITVENENLRAKIVELQAQIQELNACLVVGNAGPYQITKKCVHISEDVLAELRAGLELASQKGGG